MVTEMLRIEILWLWFYVFLKIKVHRATNIMFPEKRTIYWGGGGGVNLVTKPKISPYEDAWHWSSMGDLWKTTRIRWQLVSALENLCQAPRDSTFCSLRQTTFRQDNHMRMHEDQGVGPNSCMYHFSSTLLIFYKRHLCAPFYQHIRIGNVNPCTLMPALCHPGLVWSCEILWHAVTCAYCNMWWREHGGRLSRAHDVCGWNLKIMKFLSVWKWTGQKSEQNNCMLCF